MELLVQLALVADFSNVDLPAAANDDLNETFVKNFLMVVDVPLSYHDFVLYLNEDAFLLCIFLPGLEAESTDAHETMRALNLAEHLCIALEDAKSTGLALAEVSEGHREDANALMMSILNIDDGVLASKPNTNHPSNC